MKEEKVDIMGNMFIESQSPYDFSTTVEKFTKEIESKFWKIANIYDLQKTLENLGKVVLPVKVFSLCHPNQSGKILEKDSARILSSMMPCRVSVYEKNDGKTYISRMNSNIIAKGFSGIIEEVMTSSATEVEKIIESCIS